MLLSVVVTIFLAVFQGVTCLVLPHMPETHADEGEHFTLWPPLRDAADLKIGIGISSPAYLAESGTRIVEAKQRVDVTCLTLDGYQIGGLANALGYLNVALDYARMESIQMAYPKISIHNHHHIGEQMADLFQKDLECKPRPIPHYVATCDLSLPNEDRVSLPFTEVMKERCGSSQMVVNTTFQNLETIACKCQQMIVLPVHQMIWSFDYSRTRTELQFRYWQVHPTTFHYTGLTQVQRNIVVHVRLGDVKNWPCVTDDSEGKHMCATWYTSILGAVYSVIPPACAHTYIVTDANKQDDEIRAIIDYLGSLGASRSLYGRETKVDEAFEVMTHADLLIVGGSGLSRLAAILAKDSTAVVASHTPSHPLDSRAASSTTLMDFDVMDRNRTLAAVRTNQALASMAKACLV